MKINLDFGGVLMPGRLFDTEIGRRLFEQLPVRVCLQSWGDESYGSIGVDLGEESPVPDISPGGIAYTSQGNYLCFFMVNVRRGLLNMLGRFLTRSGIS